MLLDRRTWPALVPAMSLRSRISTLALSKFLIHLLRTHATRLESVSVSLFLTYMHTLSESCSKAE